MNNASRRHFIKQSAAGLLGALYTTQGLPLPAFAQHELQPLCQELVRTWGQRLLSLQITDKNDPNYGTLIYPPENIIHGRMGDCIYPFLHLASTTQDHRYADAAVLLYRWMERTVSEEDGSWLNEPKKGAWKGTTVFSAIALGEALKYHGALLDTSLKQEMTARLKKSGDFIYNNFTIVYGNINYPITATYCLSLLGELLNEKRFSEKGKVLARKALSFITPKDKLLSGEGGPYYSKSPKGCLSVDLGYNVEESLPSLVLYAKLTNDDVVLQAVQELLSAHLAFMLPDGGWDNSWGTRNYKWTYWGSRTSDGCQPAYALMADSVPEFYKAAVVNTQLLQSCTHDGLLHGGPHYFSHNAPVSLHHTFCHIKALVTILDHGIPTPPRTFAKVTLPREQVYGSKYFEDIQTGLISVGKFRGTVTAYDRDYKDFRGGHASGGALSMLWHEKAGIILAASMNEYQLYEAGNMQQDTDLLSMCLTPRIELKEAGKTYMNIQDFGARMTIDDKDGEVTVRTSASLVDKDQQAPASGDITCTTSWRFSKDRITLRFKHNGSEQQGIRIILPLISPSTEVFRIIKPEMAEISKMDAQVRLKADKPLNVLPMTGKRVFNYVPGLEAIPFYSTAGDLEVVITIS